MALSSVVEYPSRVRDLLEYSIAHPMPAAGDRMSYEPFEKLDPGRLPDVAEGGIQREDVVLSADEAQPHQVP